MEVFSLRDFLRESNNNSDLLDDEESGLELKEILNIEPEELSPMRLQQRFSDPDTLPDEILDGDDVPLTGVADIFSLSTTSPTLLSEEKRRQGFLFHRMVIQLYSITKPVMGMLFLVYLYVRFILIPSTSPKCTGYVSPIYDPYSNPHAPCPSIPPFVTRLLVYDQPPHDSNLKIFAGSFLNAALIVGLAAFFTTLFVILFLFEYKKLLLCLLRVVLAILLAGPWAYFLFQLVSVFNLRMEYVSYLLIVFNFSVVGWYYIVIVNDDQDSNIKNYLLYCYALQCHGHFWKCLNGLYGHRYYLLLFMIYVRF